MLKRACRGPSDGICSIQERTVWVTEKKHETRSWLVFGGNNAYVEVWEQRSGNHTAFFGRVAENNKKVRGRVGDSSSKTDLTFDRSMLALTEHASYPPSQQCPLSVSTGVYRVRGLDETSASVTDGTYEPLHGVTGHMRWQHDGDSSSSSSSASDSSTWGRKRDRMHEQYAVSSGYRHRKFRREQDRNNCGVFHFEHGKYVEDHCALRRHRFEDRGMIMIDSCRGGVPPECDCKNGVCSEMK